MTEHKNNQKNHNMENSGRFQQSPSIEPHPHPDLAQEALVNTNAMDEKYQTKSLCIFNLGIFLKSAFLGNSHHE
jgi:hypothetical protein